MNHPTPLVDAALETEIGWIALELEGPAIRRLTFLAERPAVDPESRCESVAAASAAVSRFLEDGGTIAEAPPVRLGGTDFQRRVWAALRQIPPGVTRTYGELARQLGSAPRAIGGACRANPVPLFVPCHRVVASTGAGGFAGRSAGRWPAIKRWLLAREGVRFD